MPEHGRWARGPIRGSRPSLLLVLAVLLLTGAGCLGSAGEDDAMVYGSDVEIGPGTAVALISDGNRAYLATAGLFSFTANVSALNASGNVLWSTVWPDPGIAILLGGDGRIYVRSGSAISALSRDGERLGFDATSRGQMSWHPWGLLMTWGQGIAVLDAYGNELLSAHEDVVFHRVAAAPDGSVYALVTVEDDAGESSDQLWKMQDRLGDPLWWLEFPPGERIAAHPRPPGLAVHEDFVAYAVTTQLGAITHPGVPLWNATRGNGSGPLLIDADGTTYLGGAGRTAISADGEILWNGTGFSRMVLTEGGLAMMGVEATAFGGTRAALGRVDRRSGEFTPEATFGIASDFLAPVVVGGRLLAAAHVIETSRGAVGDDITVSQSARAFTLTGPGARSAGAWNAERGPGGRGALPTLPVLPDEESLRGLWVATRDGAMRAIRFSDYALNFGLRDTRVYGIWDGEMQRAPRLVQVGTWSLEGDRLTLSPQEDLAGARGRTSLRMRAASPGILDIDDPLQTVRRSFARAARLPGLESTGDPFRVTWIDESGALRAEFSEVTYSAPAANGRTWVAVTYNATGHLGPWQYRPSFVDTDNRGNVTSNLIHQVIGLLGPDRTWERAYHHEVASGPQSWQLRDDGDGFRMVGVVATGARNREELLALRVEPSGDTEFALVETTPWPLHEQEGRVLRHFYSSLVDVLTDDDMVLLSARARPQPERLELGERQSVLVRLGPGGELRWEMALGENDDDVRLHSATVAEAQGSVLVAGTTFVPLLTPEGDEVDPWDTGRLFVARFNLQSGALEALRGLGRGAIARGFGSGVITLSALPDGGFAMLATHNDSVPFNAGTGGPVRPEADNLSTMLLSFDGDLNTRWGYPIASLTRARTAAEGAATGCDTCETSEGIVRTNGPWVLRDGSILLGGSTEGLFRVQGLVAGAAQRRTPLLHFSACGNLLPIRRFNARLEVHHIAETPEGEIMAGGGYQSNLIEPPYVIGWPGRLPTPNDPYGNVNNLLMTLAADDRLALPTSDACDAQAQGRSTLRVAPMGLGRGRVVSSPPGIDCPGQCSAVFDDLTEITLEATPEAGHVFSHFRHVGDSPSRCEGQEACGLLLLDDTVVEARFANADVAWVQPIPLQVGHLEESVQRVGEQVAVWGTTAAVIPTLRGPYDPAQEGAPVLAFLSAAGIERVHPLPAHAIWRSDAQGWIVAVHDQIIMEGLVPGGSFTAQRYVVAYAPDGALRWYQPLAHGSGSSAFRIAMQSDRVAVLWLASGPVVLDEVEAMAPYAALAIFALEDGALLGLNVDSVLAPVNLVPHGERGFRLHYPPVNHRQVLEFGEDAALLRTFLPPPIQPIHRILPDGQGEGLSSELLDESGAQTWVIPQGHRSDFDSAGAWLGEVSLPSPFLRGWSAGAVNASVMRLDHGGVPTHVWTTPAEDEVELRKLFALDERYGVAILRGRQLRNGSGEILHTDPDTWVAVGIQLMEEP